MSKYFTVGLKLKGESLEENLDHVYKKYGSKFFVKWKTLIIPMKMEIMNQPGLSYYLISSSETEEDDSGDLILKIAFFDKRTFEVNGNSYIQTLGKLKGLTGTNVIHFCLDFQRTLGVKKTLLIDGATVRCKSGEQMDLSFIKLLEYNQTFYMKNGFSIEPNPSHMQARRSVKDTTEIIKSCIKEIKNIKISDIVAEYQSIIDLGVFAGKTNYARNFVIYINISGFDGNRNILHSSGKDTLNEIRILINNSLKVMQILNKVRQKKFKFLYELMIYLFNHSCEEYILFNELFIENRIYSITYGSKKIIRKYIAAIHKLIYEKETCLYSYTF